MIKILYIIDVPFSIKYFSEDVEVVYDFNMVNWCWEIWEGIELGKYLPTYIVYSGNLVIPSDFDIVYVPHDGLIEIGFEIAKNFNKPFVVQCISEPSKELDTHWLNVFKVIESDYVPFITCVSPYVCRRWNEYFKQRGINKEVIYIPHGVNNVIADKITICPSERTGFITIARLMPWKRVDTLIKVFGKMLRDDLIIIGDGPERRELEKLNILYLKPATFIGAVDDLTKFKLLANAKAYTQASIAEQFSLPPIEASYVATPSIVYKQHVVYEIHQDNPAVMFWETEEELEKIIEKIDNMEVKEINEIGLKGREWVIKKGFTLTQRTQKLVEILNEWFRK